VLVRSATCIRWLLILSWPCKSRATTTTVYLMRAGKLPREMLERYVLARTGAHRGDVVVGPMWGVDAAVVRHGDGYLVISTDPITAATAYIGLLAVHVSTNDVAVMGGEPRWLAFTIMLGEGADERVLDAITAQIDEAARRLGVQVVGGHTEVTPGIDGAIVVGTAVGVARRYYTAAGARPGDAIVLTKGAAVEGTAVLAHDFEEDLLVRGVPRRVVEDAKRYMWMTSVVGEAMLAVREFGDSITAMHDPTEGGLLSALHELADASGVGIEVDLDSVYVAPETREVCAALGVDPYRLLSSGSLVITVRGVEEAEGLVERLRAAGVWAGVIGTVREPGFGRRARIGGRVVEMPRPERDEIWRLVERSSGQTSYASSGTS